jgi:hypothetical protein
LSLSPMSGSPSFATLRNKEANEIGLNLLACMGSPARFGVFVAQPGTRGNSAIRRLQSGDRTEIITENAGVAGLRNSDT